MGSQSHSGSDSVRLGQLRLSGPADGRTSMKETASERQRTGFVPVHYVPATFKDHRMSFGWSLKPDAPLAKSHSSHAPSGLWSQELRCTCSFSSRSLKAATHFHPHCGVVRVWDPGVDGDVAEESFLVTSRTRRTLCCCAETSSPAPCGARCEGQNTWEEIEGEEIKHFSR